MILLGTSSSHEDAAAACEALGEELWSPANATASIQSGLDYLVLEGRATARSQFWVASGGGGRRAISASGQVSAVDADLRLPALCTQSAPLATSSRTDSGSQWQVSARSNNEDLIGWVTTSLATVWGCCGNASAVANVAAASGIERAFAFMASGTRHSRSGSRTLNSTQVLTERFRLHPSATNVLRAQPLDPRTVFSSIFGRLIFPSRGTRTPRTV